LSDFFRSSVATRVKSPAELVAGVVVTAGTHDFPNSSLPSLGSAAANMGQNLMTPPTVEGWHYGYEWIDGGTLNNRVNFAATHISQAIEMGVFRSSTREEVTRILFTKGTGYKPNYLRGSDSKTARIRRTKSDMITIESSRSSVLPDATPRIPESAPVFLGEDETLKLHVFIDKSIVEVFVNGQQCVAQRVYPGLDDSDGISFRAQGRDMKIVSLDAWEMKNIYD